MVDLEKSEFPLIRSLELNRYELHAVFRDFLREKLLKVEGKETDADRPVRGGLNQAQLVTHGQREGR